ncbi:PspC domain-containing protein [Pararhodonellum marinum]|uniref:PspC domain-containing protein n=1 Tax=Pararhodonellum marinum TaxID=2755358 RepID=UPI00188E0512|nr:PspC domain-containing protein [Pararhodonellum marinum]
MKKTISINISGILFHIEEDGYTSLKKYLESINKHFSHYEDNHEIISDIENRIAEIFLSNLKNNKQVITAENVENLIEKMGTIADFKAVEEDLIQEEPAKEQVENDFYKYITPPQQEGGKGYKKLSRLENRKILGGVCAGFAHYLAIDPLWTRLVAILLLFSGGIAFKSSEIFFLPGAFDFKFSFGAWTAIAYILLWIILPVSHEEPEDKNIKKLYRNPDDRVLGGVSSGLAAYFNIDVLWIRLIFVGLVFAGGSGIVIYLILWIITPLAQSITERIKMKGGEITLTNIENTIKENMAPPYKKEESQLRKILLAPFRFLGAVINGIGIALGPFGRFLLDVVRVAFGLLIFFLGMVIILVPIVFLGVYFELLVGDSMSGFMDAVPMEMMAEFMPVWLAIALSIAILIPGIILTLSGISVVVKRSLIDSRFGLVAFGIWILSIMICAFQIPKTAAQFKNEATYVNEERIELSEGTWLIKSTYDRKNATDFSLVSLTLQGTTNEQANLMQRFKSKGRSFDDALRNAEDIKYAFGVQDTVINFDRSIAFSSMAKFRGQNLSQTLEIPYDQPFVLDKSILPIIRNTIYKHGYKIRDVNSRNHWVFNEDGLLCLNCVNDHKNNAADSLSRSKFNDAYFMNK